MCELTLPETTVKMDNMLLDLINTPLNKQLGRKGRDNVAHKTVFISNKYIITNITVKHIKSIKQKVRKFINDLETC